MTPRIRKYARLLHTLCKCDSKVTRSLLKSAPRELLNCISEISLNTLRGKVQLSGPQKKALNKHKSGLRKFANRSTPDTIKRKIVQRGGFLGSLLSPIISILGGLFNPSK